MLWAVVEKYDATHSDTERANPSADIGEVVPEFGTLAVTHRLNPPDTTATWHQIPDGAKHKDGHRARATPARSPIPSPNRSPTRAKTCAGLLTVGCKITLGRGGQRQAIERNYDGCSDWAEGSALGYVRPIGGDNITLSDATKAKVPRSDHHSGARPINASVRADAAKPLARMRQDQVATMLQARTVPSGPRAKGQRLFAMTWRFRPHLLATLVLLSAFELAPMLTVLVPSVFRGRAVLCLYAEIFSSGRADRVALAFGLCRSAAGHRFLRCADQERLAPAQDNETSQGQNVGGRQPCAAAVAGDPALGAAVCGDRHWLEPHAGGQRVCRCQPAGRRPVYDAETHQIPAARRQGTPAVSADPDAFRPATGHHNRHDPDGRPVANERL